MGKGGSTKLPCASITSIEEATEIFLQSKVIDSSNWNDEQSKSVSQLIFIFRKDIHYGLFRVDKKFEALRASTFLSHLSTPLFPF